MCIFNDIKEFIIKNIFKKIQKLKNIYTENVNHPL